MPDKKPLDAGLIARLVRGVKTIIRGDQTTDFGPGQPLAPLMPDAAGRQFDYPFAINTQTTVRTGEPTTFAMMRSLADNYDLLRLVIETRKDQLEKLKWVIKPLDEDSEDKDSDDKTRDGDERCDQLTELLRFPDQEHPWSSWLRMLVEEMLVTDAATIYPRLSKGGELLALELMDGTTLHRLIDNTGRTPLPPNPAYQQIIKGLPAVNYSRDELIYAPRNQRVHKLYGYSPVEQIIMTVNVALRRQLHQLQYYTEGSTPDLILTVPETWNPDQIKQFQTYWNAILQGNTAQRRGTQFVPSGVNVVNTKEAALKDQYDDWLARIVCYAFSVSPQALIAQMNRATAQTAHESAIEEGLAPLQTWVKNTINTAIWKYTGYTDLSFDWEEEEAVDPQAQAQIYDIYVRNGVYSVDEVREKLGEEAIGMPNAIYTGTGATLIEDVLNPPDPVVMPMPDGTTPRNTTATIPTPQDKQNNTQFDKRKKKVY